MTAVKVVPPLQGRRRELTREVFEHLCALQCRLPEILGYAGVTEKQLASWCKRMYRLPLSDAMDMLRQDGLIEIRQAGFDLLKKSAPLIGQQYNRYLNAPAEDQAKQAAALARQIFSLDDPGDEAVGALFEEE